MRNHTKIGIFFSKKINQLRIDKNLSLEKAGNLIGIPMVELYKYEKLKLSPTLSIMEKIAKAYNVSLESLYNEEKEEIVAYKLLIRSFLEIENYSGYPIVILFETILDKQEYLNNLWIEAYFTKINGEIIIEVIKEKQLLPYQIIKWQDYMKYKAIKLNPKKKVKKNNKDYEKIFGYYEPCSENFDILLEKYGLKVKEGEKILLRCLGIEETTLLTKKDVEFLGERLF